MPISKSQVVPTSDIHRSLFFFSLLKIAFHTLNEANNHHKMTSLIPTVVNGRWINQR